MKNNNFSDDCINKLTHNKKVLFITTKNIDYIRNSQEISCIKKSAQLVKVVGYEDKSYIIRLIKIYIKLLLMPLSKYDFIFVGFAPQLILPFWGFKFKSKFIVEDFFISMYDTMINDRKKFRKNSLFAKIFLWLDKITLKSADKIIVDTCAHGEYFVSKLGADKSKINVLYLKADKTIYYPRLSSKADEYNNKFVVLYFGSILPLQGVDIIMQCAESMESVSAVFFEIIGPINNKHMSKYRHLKNVKFVPWLSQESLSEKIAAADLCLAGHFNNMIEKASRTIPGKAYIYDSMKKPMILGDNSANRELFEEDNVNYYYVEMGNYKKLEEKILYIMDKKCRIKL